MKIPQGWGVCSTGGGCTALSKYHGKDGCWFITNINGFDVPAKASERCQLSFDYEQIQVLCFDCKTVSAALSIVAKSFV